MRAAPASGQISRAQARRDGRPFAASTGTSPDRDLQASHAAPSRRRHRATPTDRITVSDGEDKAERTPSRLICLLTWSVGIGTGCYSGRRCPATTRTRNDSSTRRKLR